MLRSSAGAEWVSAPIEISSTPVAATSATLSSVIPPEASRLAPPPARVALGDGLAQLGRVHVVEQQPVGPGGERLGDLGRVRHSTSTWRRAAPRARPSTARRRPRASAMWFSLIRIASSSPRRWLRPPPAATAAFSSAAQARGRLAGVEDRRARAVDRGDEARGQGRDPRQVAEQVERRALAGEQGPGRAGDGATSAGTPLPPLALADQRLELVDAGLLERLPGRGEPEHGPRLFLDDPSPRLCRRRDGRLRGDVAGPDVLGERSRDQLPKTLHQVERGNTAIVAVNPCRKLRPPTGPISPRRRSRRPERRARPRARSRRGRRPRTCATRGRCR